MTIKKSLSAAYAGAGTGGKSIFEVDGTQIAVARVHDIIFHIDSSRRSEQTRNKKLNMPHIDLMDYRRAPLGQNRKKLI